MCGMGVESNSIISFRFLVTNPFAALRSFFSCRTSEISSLSNVIIALFPVSAGSDKALFEAMFN